MRDQNTSCFEIDEFGCVSYLHKQRGFLPRCNYVERLRRSQGLSPRPHGLTAGEGPRGQSQRMTPSRSTSVSFIGHHASNMRVTGSGFFFLGGAVHICCRNAGASFNRARCRADCTVHCVASILAVPGLLACHWVHESPLSNSALEPRQFTTLLIQRRKVAARPTARPKR